ncbi:hypothetical protein [Streptomyces sp. NPDC093225]|uniref:hypothetical protein n=1 Tax=Streptomyces sp. NPDC093225 TaxID=3366034 RepID=UPI0037F27A66
MSGERVGRADVPGPEWWAQDPEHWELLRFEAVSTADGPTGDRAREDRAAVLDLLVTAPGPVGHGFARFLLEQEILFHKDSWGFHHGIEVAAVLLAEHRRPEDVWLLWEAVTTSFDTWCGLPHRLLFAAGGSTGTLAHVAGSGDERREHLLELLRDVPAASEDEVGAFVAERRRYYAEILRQLDAAPDADAG